MKLIIEMDLGEAQRALTTGSLMTLCESLGDESLARQQLKETVNTKKPVTPASKPTEFVKETPKEKTGGTAASTPASAFTEMDEPEAGDDGCPFEKGAPAEEETSSEDEEITIEMVRAKLSVLTKAGKQAELKAIFAKVGATKLSEVDPAQYAKVIKLAEKVQA